MIVRTLEAARKGGRNVKTQGWESARLLLKNDGVGFSFHITTIYEGAELPMKYTNHFEAVYCIFGEGEVETVRDHRVYPIVPGTVYVLNEHDEHILRAHTELVLACVFNPPLNGKEVHDTSGAYPLEAETVSDG